MANEIERRFGGLRLRVLSLHPGVIFETDISRHQDGGRYGICGRMHGVNDRIARDAKSMAQGAATQVWTAVAEKLEGVGGLYSEDVQLAEEVQGGENVRERAGVAAVDLE
jgi:hypothetical protein